MSDPFAALQRLLPQHALSRCIGKLANSRTRWIRRAFIHGFARAYGVTLDDADHDSLDDYRSFNEFFTRALRVGARPMPSDPRAAVCPADGSVSQVGPIDNGNLLQAKGNLYSLTSLLGEPHPEFDGGTFCTIYLAPHNYHRVHLPVAGTLMETTAIPGQLFSVNARTEASIQSLFARNERLVCRFATAHGAMAVVLVGALIVASIETVWGGTPSPYQRVSRTPYDLTFERGAEIGRFLVGSTVIVCFEPGRVTLDPNLKAGSTVRVGQSLGSLS